MPQSLHRAVCGEGDIRREGVLEIVNPVRNSSGALNPAGIVLKCNPAAKQGGIISNGVKVLVKEMRGERSD
jgi:hypothetical protein